MKIQFVLREIEDNQRRAKMVRYQRQDGMVGEFLAAKRGNATYAFRSSKQFNTYKQNFLCGLTDNSVMFITLGGPHKKSYHGCRDSWIATANAIGPFIKALKAKGAEKYIAVLEATSEGVCHAHLVIDWDRPLQVCIHNNKYHLAEKDLLSFINKRWKIEWAKVSDLILNSNSIVIQICPNLTDVENVFNYVTKYLGKKSNISNSLIRVQQYKATDDDCAKLFTNFWAFKLKYRVYRVSRNLGRRAVFIKENNWKNYGFEVIIPKTDKQGVEVTNVGGNVEVRAIKDLEVQYNKLFAALKVQPSQIGFGEENTNAIGESNGQSYDRRFARTCKTLVYAVQQVVKNFDYLYLRSRGYDVKMEDWKYGTVSLSVLEDQERGDTLSKAVENLKAVADVFQSVGIEEYNKNYLIEAVWTSPDKVDRKLRP